MADYVTKIRTSTGDKQIDYNALVNKPNLDPTGEVESAGGIIAYLASKYDNAEVTTY